MTMIQKHRTRIVTTLRHGMTTGKVLALKYHGFSRVVEAHALGMSSKGHMVLRAYQLSGDTLSDNSEGWKLFSVSSIDNARMTDEVSQAPRPGYQPGDKGMVKIIQQVSG